MQHYNNITTKGAIMQAIYPYAQIVHLFCAIIFIGYLFFDVVVMKFVAKHITKAEFSKMQDAIEGVTRFMPLVVLVLFLSGGMMASSYIGFEAGFCTTTFQKVFMAKIILASCIFLLVVMSLTFHFVLKRPNPIGKYISMHTLVFAIGVCVTLLAKIMFMV